MNTFTTLNPGEGAVFKCPEGSEPQLTLEVLAQYEAKGLHLATVSKDSLFVGPLKYGRFQIQIPCKPEGGISQIVEINPPEKPSQPSQPSPLGLINPPIPVEFFVFWLLVFFVTTFGGYFFYHRWKNSRMKPLGDNNHPVDPDAPKREWMRTLAELSTASEPQSQTLHRAAPDLRRYLEYRLGFSAAWASTPEFIGSLTAATLGASIPPSYFQEIERTLYALDSIRFAKKLVTPEEQQILAIDLKKITDTTESFRRNVGSQV
jgi:hypothetical protein